MKSGYAYLSYFFTHALLIQVDFSMEKRRIYFLQYFPLKRLGIKKEVEKLRVIKLWLHLQRLLIFMRLSRREAQQTVLQGFG